MADRYPGYDVLDKRNTASWDEKTRDVIDRRLALREDRTAVTPEQLATLRLVVDRIAPSPEGRRPANTLAMVLEKIARDEGDGYRPASFPRVRECWRRALDAIEAEAQVRHNCPFARLDGVAADAILADIEKGEVRASAWTIMRPETFFRWRLLPDILVAHWSDPSLWSAMGFGGPASPRGYVRLAANTRDAWEAEER